MTDTPQRHAGRRRVEPSNGFVARPVDLRGRRLVKYRYDAIVATAKNGKAVEVSYSGRSSAGVWASIYHWLSSRGYKGHHRTDAPRKVLIVWCEKVRR